MSSYHWRCLTTSLKSLYFLFFCLLLQPLLSESYEVMFAMNCGGQNHRGAYGIRYKADNNNVGIASEFGKSLIISRVPPEDMVIYQTERYHTTSFSYEVPIIEDGEYVIIAKFAEVYFQHPGGKVFDVILNQHHMAVSNLDIFAKVGKAAAHDELIPFTIESGQLLVGDDSSEFDGILTIEFSKGHADNPKVNAIVLLKGSLEEAEQIAIPTVRTPAESAGDQDPEFDDTPIEDEELKFKRTSGPKSKDPYASDDSWFMPITMAVAVFLPVLFCLCRVR